MSDGYAIRNLSVAVLVNRGRLAALLGANASQADIDNRVAEIEQLVESAAGFNKQRGDQIKVAAVSFIDDGRTMEPTPPLGIAEILMRQFGNIINATTILVVATMLIWFGLRPAVTAILARPETKTEFEAAVPALEAAAAQGDIAPVAQLEIVTGHHPEPDRGSDRQDEPHATEEA